MASAPGARTVRPHVYIVFMDVQARASALHNGKYRASIKYVGGLYLQPDNGETIQRYIQSILLHVHFPTHTPDIDRLYGVLFKVEPVGRYGAR